MRNRQPALLNICLALLVLGSAAPLSALPLNKKNVSGDAKWLLHLDMEKFRGTRLGQFVDREILDKQLKALKPVIKIDPGFIYRNIGAITAYGSDYQTGPEASGVILIKTDLETQKVLEGLLVSQLLVKTNGPVKKLQQDPYAVYSVGKDFFISPRHGEMLILGKSQKQITRAKAVLDGKENNLVKIRGVFDIPDTPETFFFFGLSDILKQPMHPRAQILQMAEGARIGLGERGNNLFLNLTLKGKTAEVAGQIQQVIEGMLALVTLGKVDDPEILQLVRSLKLARDDRTVSIAIEYPLTSALQKISEEAKKHEKKESAPKIEAEVKVKEPSAAP